MIRRLFCKALLIIMTFQLHNVALASSVVDQNNPSVINGFCQIANNLCGQSFQQNETNISGAGIFLGSGWSGSGHLTFSIFESYGSTPSGLVAQGTSGLVNQDSGWVDVFWAPQTITPASTYYLVLESTDPNLVAMYGDPAYAPGNALYAGTAYDGISQQNFDLSFRTFSGNVAVVPVPAAVWLFGSGLIGLVAVARRRYS